MVAYLFAGQGSQYIGMGKDLYEAFPESKAVFDKANEVLGFDLKQSCFAGPEEFLKTTNISQPAIVTVSLAAYAAFKVRAKEEPKFFAGLSLGEYTALIASGVLSLEAGLRLVRRRGEIMDEASRRKPGKMAAVLDLSFEQVKDICLKSGAEIANLNAPGQVVISGRVEAVDKAKELCLQAGAKRIIDLETSGGFHSSLMSEAALELKQFLEKIPVAAPSIPVVSNYTALPE
ncbi:MAG: ACP S-malonyltransferase, partial [Candidatus Omnitrophica bacterium]|nr:ACP S-malonyltransferase [Candidatus Omnitrophota bacterium]